MRKDSYNGHPNDIIIIVLGPIGSGRTNFINKFTGKVEEHNQGTLMPDTKIVTPYPVSYNGSNLVLVDTPGLDDPHRLDTIILGEIAHWLKQKYPNGATLKASGIIYLHRITDNRPTESVCKNLKKFAQLCSDIPLNQARLVTTMWDEAEDRTEVEIRERKLKNEFWKELTDRGAIATRFNNRPDGAKGIIDDLLRLIQSKGPDRHLHEKDVDTSTGCFCGLFHRKR